MNHRVARYWRSIFLLLGVLLLSGHAVAREVRVGVYENMPKIFTDADGKPTGILIDVLQEVASREDWQLKFVICAWQTCLDKLVAGEIDLMPDIAYSAERDQLFDFHRTPALYSWSQLYRRVDVTISSPLDLQGKKIVFLDGAIQEQGLTAMLDAFGVKPRMQPKKSLEDAFAAAQRGEADAVVANHYYGDLKSHQFGLVDTPVVFQPARLFYATAQGKNSWLLSAIDEYLVEWMQDQNSPYFKIIKHWGGEVPQETVPTHLWSVLGIAIGLMLVLSMFTLVLRRQVDLKTKQLAEKSANLSATLNAIPDLLFEVDLDGRYCEIHASRAELLAAPKSDLIGKKISDILPREAASICMDALQQANSQGWAGGYQIELPLPQGKSWFELSVAKKPSDDHASPRFIVMSRDVTDRALAESRLQRLTQLYAALSQCNQAIVRCSNESELFPQICSDAVMQ
ncbi:MAG: transporter substrate-binding domain-containing protein [Gallionella sp.]|nr:transporter substrate-binding domain-containing protein [Gallionella sp.]